MMSLSSSAPSCCSDLLDPANRRRLREERDARQTFKRRNVQADDDLQQNSVSSADSVIPSGLVASLGCELPQKQLEAVMTLTRMLAREQSSPISKVEAIVPRLVEFLQLPSASARLKLESARALTNITFSKQAHYVFEAEAVPTFVSIMENSTDEELREQAVLALGNIASDSLLFRDHVVNRGILVPLLHILTHISTISVAHNAAWCLSNVCRGISGSLHLETVNSSLAVLTDLLDHKDEELVTYACWALAHLSDGPTAQIQLVIDAGVCKKLVDLLMDSSDGVVTAALRAVGNIITGDDAQVQAVLNCKVLGRLRRLTSTGKESLSKEVCWTLSNIASGNTQLIQAIIDANIFPAVIKILKKAEISARKEAAWVIGNATSEGTSEQVAHLVDLGCIPPLCDLLSAKDESVLQVALFGLENILRVGDFESSKKSSVQNAYLSLIEKCSGLGNIVLLQSHENPEIYQRALDIVKGYFGIEVFTSANASSILTNNLEFIKGSSKMTGIVANIIDNNIFQWNVMIKGFPKSCPLDEDIQKLSERHGYDFFELQLDFAKDLYPFYPPLVKVIRPRLQSSTKMRFATMEILRLSHWEPTRTMEFVLRDIKAFLQEWARLDLDSDSTYDDIEHHLLRLALVSETVPTGCQEITAAESGSSHKAAAAKSESSHGAMAAATASTSEAAVAAAAPTEDKKQGFLNRIQKALGLSKRTGEKTKKLVIVETSLAKSIDYSSYQQKGWDVERLHAALKEKDKQIALVLAEIDSELNKLHGSKHVVPSVLGKVLEGSALVPFLEAKVKAHGICSHTDAASACVVRIIRASKPYLMGEKMEKLTARLTYKCQRCNFVTPHLKCLQRHCESKHTGNLSMPGIDEDIEQTEKLVATFQDRKPCFSAAKPRP